MAGEQSLLARLASQMGWTYISDLRFLTGEKRRMMADKLISWMPQQDDLREWLEAVSYLISATPERTT